MRAGKGALLEASAPLLAATSPPGDGWLLLDSTGGLHRLLAAGAGAASKPAARPRPAVRVDTSAAPDASALAAGASSARAADAAFSVLNAACQGQLSVASMAQQLARWVAWLRGYAWAPCGWAGLGWAGLGCGSGRLVPLAADSQPCGRGRMYSLSHPRALPAAWARCAAWAPPTRWPSSRATCWTRCPRSSAPAARRVRAGRGGGSQAVAARLPHLHFAPLGWLAVQDLPAVA